MIENILLDVSNNFSFTFIIIVNVITYLVIKLLDYLNGDKYVPVIFKRGILLLVTVVMFIVYSCCSDIATIILINSAVAAPVSWSWVLTPILKKLNFDYKQIDKYIS